MARRSPSMDSDAGVWGPSVSGRIEDKEDPLQTVLREAQEELGITTDLINPQFLHNSYHQHKDGQRREFKIYFSKVKSEILNYLVLDPREVAEVKWSTLPEIQELVKNKSGDLIISSDSKIWDSILHYLKQVIN